MIHHFYGNTFYFADFSQFPYQCLMLQTQQRKSKYIKYSSNSARKLLYKILLLSHESDVNRSFNEPLWKTYIFFQLHYSLFGCRSFRSYEILSNKVIKRGFSSGLLSGFFVGILVKFKNPKEMKRQMNVK